MTRGISNLPPFGDRRRRCVGLLGGSFNPAHDGHLHITREAIRRLGLHQVWWLVSPQNPLKPTDTMALLQDRMRRAQAVACGRRIIVTDIERCLGTTRTFATLRHLTRRYPHMTFVWIMGADNLAQMPRWARWVEIMTTVRIAVLHRSPYSYRALSGTIAKRFAKQRRVPGGLLTATPPAWSYLAIQGHPANATALRAGSKASNCVLNEGVDHFRRISAG